MIQLKNAALESSAGKKSVHALRCLNVTLPETGLVVLTGASGSGKTALLHLLALRETPSRGEILIGGENTAHWSEARRSAWLRECAAADEALLFADLTLSENAERAAVLAGFSGRDARENAREALALLGLEGTAGVYPDRLSGEQRRLGALACALARKGRVLLLDEPADGLSAESAETVLAEPASEYQGRGEERGPWDVNDEDVPDYDDYLDLGAYYLPFLQGIQLRIKANRAIQQVLGSTITFGSSSLEIEAFAAPKTLGLWDDVRGDLLEANKAASEVDGVFGTELKLPVNVKGGKTVNTRIVGVDGPRWMLRGIFSGKAAIDPDSPETEALNKFFAGIVVERGEEPLAPRDLIPMHPPVAPAERKAAKAAAEAGEENGKEHFKDIPDNKPKGPLSQDQTTEVKTTLARGPMFSEVR